MQHKPIHSYCYTPLSMKIALFLSNMIISLLMLNSTGISAQTKKIAWRSHGGSNTTFTFEVPGEFGLSEPMIYKKVHKRLPKDSTTALDSLAVCQPAADAKPVLPNPTAIQKKEKQERRQQHKAKRQQVRKEIKTLKKELREELKVTSSASTATSTTNTAATLPTPEGATQWLWLLLLPLAFVFGASLQKP